MYCQGCKPSLCVSATPDHKNSFCTLLDLGGSSPPPPPHPTPCNQACAGSSAPHFPPVTSLGLEEGGAVAKHTSPTIFFPKPNYDGHRPRPGPAKMLPCEYLNRALLWEPGITRAWHLSPACLVTLGRSKPHCKKSRSLCLSP